MGTCLLGIVEYEVVRDTLDEEKADYDGRLIQWEYVANIEFHKNYPLMRVLHAKAEDGWPGQVSFSARVLKESGEADTGLHWASFLTFKSIMEEGPENKDDEDLFQGTPKATLEFMRSFEGEGKPVRILFYEV